MHFDRLFATDDSKHHLTGYYDKTVVTPSGDKLCCIEVPFIDQLPDLSAQNHKSIIKVIDLNTENYLEVDTTSAWNFQQGCGLQFINSGNEIIYLDAKDGQVSTKIVNLEDGRILEMGHAYYSYSIKLNGFVGIDHERYSAFRPSYSYPMNARKSFKKYDPNDFIFFFDINTRVVKNIIQMSDLEAFRSPINYRDSINYLEHLTFSPDGTKFVFVHRFVTPEKQLYSRLFIYDFTCAKLELLHYSGRVTHFNWLDNGNLILWQGGNTVSQRIKSMRIMQKYIRPLLKVYKKIIKANSEIGMTKLSRSISGDCYGIIDINSKRLHTAAFSDIMHDGHPSVSDPNTIISDTYPYGEENTIDLYSYNYVTRKKTRLWKFPHPKEFNLTALRCDTHPKVDQLSRTVTVDVVKHGQRQVQIFSY